MRKRNTFAGIIFLSFVLFYTVYTFHQTLAFSDY